MIPLWYQIGIPLFFLAVAVVGGVLLDLSGRRLDRQMREDQEAKHRPAE